MSGHFQSKLGEGLSKFQGGIEQGKQKLQVAQEVSRLKKEIQETSVRKSKILLELGLRTYQKIRTGEIDDEELVELTKNVYGFDQHLYASSRKVAELNKKEEESGSVCPSCETVNSADAKFCGGCGTKVERAAAVESVEGTACVRCEETVPEEAQFCSCCGVKV
ncbi:zinc ribbon domain-containing protein [Halalkalibacter krulwichiae]|uniref:Double zinc ribbon n=1 Tax=Halalkalibacter krulwichiae TaxID=199441 RepID=A0A1X9MGK8_9BACI|nr:zinc ribbon domain-containing protein [Halalkalibacter krulwichiae]ARK32568.1 Double zinc ribbon [Halalkalibacter krulwichiae]